MLEAALVNLTTPAVLAFAVGIVAAVIRSDLRLPEPVVVFISSYLLLAIGLKGGVALRSASAGDIWAPALGTLALGVATPLIAFVAMRRLGRFGVVDAAALAAHYGSVSLVTFAESLNVLEALGVPFEGFLPALLTILEVPAIVVALCIARVRSAETGRLGEVLAHVLPERSIVLLVGGMAIGAIGGPAGFAQISGFFDDPFRGVLTLFLLEMGVVAGRYLRDLRDVGPRLVGLGVGLPVVHAALGVTTGKLCGLSLGGATVLGAMAASASYIAAPAAVSMALPKANPAYYLTAAIGITFPFNVAIGIPLYHAMANALY